MRAAVCFIATLAFAHAAHAEPCKTQGEADAKELTFDLKSAEMLRGMHYAFRFGLMPAEFPVSDIAAIAQPCSRGTFPVDSDTLELFGENTDLPPRWSKRATRDSPIIYVALMPRPAPAAAWADRRARSLGDGSVSFKENEMMVAVVRTDGRSETRLIFAFFDKLPDDERLKAIIQSVGTHQARWQVAFDVKTRKVTPNSE